MEVIGTFAGQAALLAPLVVAFAAMLFQALNLSTRYKPAASVTIGILLGVALSFSQDQRLIDGAWVGGLSGLIASGLYTAGKMAEIRNSITAESTTTVYVQPTELPPKPVELPHG